MFDSLSLVGELVGLTDDRLTEVLSAAFGDDQQRERRSLPFRPSPRPGSRTRRNRRRRRKRLSDRPSISPLRSLRSRTSSSTASTRRSSRRSLPGSRTEVPRGRPARCRGRDLHPRTSRRWNAPTRIRAARACSARVRRLSSLRAAPHSPQRAKRARTCQRSSVSGRATLLSNRWSPCAPNASRPRCFAAARSSTRAAQPTTTCSATGPTSRRPEGSARAPGRASSVSILRARDRCGGRCSPTSDRALGQQARPTPHGSMTHTAALPLQLAKSRSDARAPWTRGWRWRSENSSAFPIS